LFGGEGFIMQKLEGDGFAFVHSGGHVIEKHLQPGEVLKVDTGCIVAFTADVNYDIQFVGGIKIHYLVAKVCFMLRLLVLVKYGFKHCQLVV